MILFNGVPQVSPHYEYLEVYFREAPGAAELVPLVAGPFKDVRNISTPMAPLSRGTKKY